MHARGRLLLASGLVCGALSLWSCGGGGGGSGGGGATSYTLGGSVSGLTGTGLVLQDNGGSSLAVPANATTFAFPSPISPGQAYSVTVSTQPTSPSQYCTVTNGSGTMASAAVSNVAVNCVTAQNVAAISLDSFNHASGGNTAYVSVTICAPGTTNCQTIDHITVDTGSFGLRILSSAINASVLPALPNVIAAGPYLAECQQFGSGYTWGSVRVVDFSIPNTNESVSSLPVQIIGDMEPAPQQCQSQAVTSGQMLGNYGYTTPAKFGANGLIGIGPFPQDCGKCVSTAQPLSNNINYLVYTACSSATNSATCNPSTATLAQQVINPVSDFAVDNTGVIIQLPAVSATGVPSVTGTLTFGIVAGAGNNSLGGATVYLADPRDAYVTTVYKGTTDAKSFIDSGSNGLYFNDSAQTLCDPTQPAASFYCPGGATAPYKGATSVDEQATFEDYHGNHATTIAFTVENENLTDVVSSGLAGTGTANEFDWGIPFFFGRKVYTAIGYDALEAPIRIGSYAAPFYAF